VSSREPHDTWPELAALVDKLLDAAPEQRDRVIDELSAGDTIRRDQLRALRVECEREPALLRTSAAERFASLFDDDARFPDALLQRYRLTRELGRGGMATVYLAHDVKHGRDVAVKVVRASVAATVGVDRFLREIEIVAQLHHPLIVPLYDSGEADGALYYVMPYVPELSLRQRIARDGPLPVDDVAFILRDVCDALAHAHAHGIVHRDIKPDNVLVSGRHALISDFGIAKAALESSQRITAESAAAGRADAGNATAAGVIVGTPTYMAPEQIDASARVDHRADIYAVGVLGYELLTGAPPFVGAWAQGILSAHLTEAPAPLTAHRPDVPPALTNIVMRSLEKRPDDRWQSAEEVGRRLEPLAAAHGPDDAQRRRARWMRAAAAVVGIAVLSAAAVVAARRSAAGSWEKRWSQMHIERFTDFPGSEVDAAISANGELVTFLSDRDSVFDAFVSRVGSGRFQNLTAGRFNQLFNEDVRNVGFSYAATDVWVRVADITARASVSRIPVTGGPPRRFLNTAVSAAWSPDGSLVAYHELTPGDPIFVADSNGANPRQLYIAPEGLHSHHPAWSPSGEFLYFTHGLPPDAMDIWRVPARGGSPERMTSHNSRVEYPVLLDDRTLVYTATADDGSGPWLYLMDVNDRAPRRLISGVEHFISIAASAEIPGKPRRLVATVSNPVAQLWTVPLTGSMADDSSARRVTLPTERAAAPRFASDGALLYLAARGGTDGVWRFSAAGATEMWRPEEGAVTSAAAVSRDGAHVCFVVRHAGRSTLRCMNVDGSGMRVVAESLDVRGAPSWSPDGRWIAIAARDGRAVRVFKVPMSGGQPVRLVDSVSFNPVWSPDGRFILYSGTPRGRGAPLQAVTPEGVPYALPFLPVSVDRLGDSYRFVPDNKALVVKLGGFRRQDFWMFDMATGRRRQLTRLRPGESVDRFDVSPDGKRIVFERVRENSDIALIELPSR
jgi:Tol biopolymer transport system component